LYKTSWGSRGGTSRWHWDFIKRLPPRLRAALIYYIESGDLRRAQWISGLDLDHFRDLTRRARAPVVN